MEIFIFPFLSSFTYSFLQKKLLTHLVSSYNNLWLLRLFCVCFNIHEVLTNTTETTFLKKGKSNNIVLHVEHAYIYKYMCVCVALSLFLLFSEKDENY